MRTLWLVLPCLLMIACSAPSESDVVEQVDSTRTTAAHGLYAVGTTYFTWTDTTRIDPSYGGYRLINVQVWYPADSMDQFLSQPSAAYYTDVKDVWAQLPGWLAADSALVDTVSTLSRVNVPVSEHLNKYPLLICSPGLGSNIATYSFYAERLARKGYIVAGVNHLYESEFIINEQRQVIPANLTFHDSLKALDIPDQISADDYRAAKEPRQQMLGEDLSFCLNRMLKTLTAISSVIDTARIGAWGHSIGGAAAVSAAQNDRRFKAVVNLDGTPPSSALEAGIDAPF